MRRNSRYFRSVLAAAGLLLAVPSPMVFAVGLVVEPLDRPAVEIRNPQGAFMMGAARAGSTIVAVGERGLVLLSDDNGQTWRQGEVPVSTGLTAVRFANEQEGMAVGHGGVVLGTSNGGETWKLLLDGRSAAELALAAAEQQGAERAIWEAKRMVDEGPDKPFLDVLLQSPDRAIVVGAYGLAFETRDGGGSWQPIMGRMANPEMSHFYAIRQRGSRVVAVGERGLVSLSNDNGVTWKELVTPYDGSFFTVEVPTGREIVAAGLKGNIWYSENSGDVWEPLPTQIDASITSSLLLPSGEVVLGNQAGLLLKMDGGGLVPLNEQRFSPINTFVQAGDQLVVLTMEGIRVAATDR